MYLFQLILGIVLLLNVSIDTIYPPIAQGGSIARMNVTSGIVTFTRHNFLLQSDRSYLQGVALASVGGSFAEMDMYSSVDLTVLGTYVSPECPHESESCLRLYVTQSPPNLPNNLTGNPSYSQLQKTPFLKVYNAPIYHAIVSNVSSNYPLEILLAAGSCTKYGYLQSVLLLCAQEYRQNDNKTTLLVGKSPTLILY